MAGVTLRLLRHNAAVQRTRRLGRRANPWLVLAIAGVVLVGVGAALFPADLPRGDKNDPGGVALEMAFWLASLASAVTSFRVMEAFFRTGDARILAPLPIPTQTLFVYRLLGAAREAMAITAGAAALFMPVLWRGDLGLYSACMLVWGLGMLTTLSVGFGVQMYAGASNVKGEAAFDAHGPTGFVMAPGIALAASVVLILVEKLVAEELLKASGVNKAARFGLGLCIGSSVVGLGLAYRWFTQHFHAMYADFLQADLFVLDVGYEYFKEGPAPPSGLDRRLPSRLIPLVRKDRLQYRRRYALSRLLSWGIAVALGGYLMAQGSGALPVALVVASPLIVLVVFANPWLRLTGNELERGLAAGLPVTRAERVQAKSWVAFQETIALTLPLAAAVTVGLGLGEGGWGYGVVAGLLSAALVLAAHPLLMFAALLYSAAVVYALGAGMIAVAISSAAVTIWSLLPLSLVMVAAAKLVDARKTNPSAISHQESH